MKYQLKSKFPRHWNCFITWHRLYEESTTQISLHPLPPLLHTPLHNLNPNTDTLNCTHWLIWTIHIYVDNRLFVTHTATHIVYHTHTPEVQNIDCNAMLHTHTHTHTHTLLHCWFNYNPEARKRHAWDSSTNNIHSLHVKCCCIWPAKIVTLSLLLYWRDQQVTVLSLDIEIHFVRTGGKVA